MGKRKVDNPDTEQSVASVYTVRRSFTRNGEIISEDDEQEEISIHKFITTPAETGVSFGSTINLGNYEAARIDVWCKVPAYREELDEAFEFAKKFADNKMTEELEKVSGSKNKNKDFSPF